MKLEADYFRGGIQNVLTFEAEERTIVNMTIDGWRNTLKRYGLVETELSMSSSYQSDLAENKR
ncbi:hypothetical protein RJ639_013986 [Escallonia herrerae]|uniref:Uncharacterized protein n=1 Tax=Escallonia herrerae TaxID=1293975 RepID=A0AA89AL75_9ASTE|nr:hypothetical protein RJ639_013986 [Escallonia herrerae]